MTKTILVEQALAKALEVGAQLKVQCAMNPTLRLCVTAAPTSFVGLLALQGFGNDDPLLRSVLQVRLAGSIVMPIITACRAHMHLIRRQPEMAQPETWQLKNRELAGEAEKARLQYGRETEEQHQKRQIALKEHDLKHELALQAHELKLKEHDLKRELALKTAQTEFQRELNRNAEIQAPVEKAKLDAQREIAIKNAEVRKAEAEARKAEAEARKAEAVQQMEALAQASEIINQRTTMSTS